MPDRLDEVFAQIVAAPDDDDARLVYADAAIDRGDATRGELIVLQIARSRDRATAAQADRERAISHALEDMAAPLLATCDAVTFERGFPVSAYMKDAAALAPGAAFDAAEWRTLRTLHGLELAPLASVCELFASGALANVASVSGLSATNLDALAPYAAAWTDVDLVPDTLAPDALARFPALRHLTLSSLAGFDEALLASARQLHSLALTENGFVITPAFFDALPALRRLEIRGGNSRTYRLHDRTFPLDALVVRAPLYDLPPWCRALPALRTLEIHGDDLLHPEYCEWDDLAAVLAMPQLAQLTLESVRYPLTARLERTASGWTLVLPCAPRAADFCQRLCEIPPSLISLGVTAVLLEPTEPRHYAEPFSDMDLTLDQLARAWSPIPVATRDVHRWPGRAPEETWAFHRRRRCPSR